MLCVTSRMINLSIHTEKNNIKTQHIYYNEMVKYASMICLTEKHNGYKKIHIHNTLYF